MTLDTLAWLGSHALTIATYLVFYFYGSEKGRAEGRAEGRAIRLAREEEIHKTTFAEGRALGRQEGFEEGRTCAFNLGHAEGREQGKIEGRVEGEAKGRIEGRVEAADALERQELRGHRLCSELKQFLALAERHGVPLSQPNQAIVEQLEDKIGLEYMTGHSEGFARGKLVTRVELASGLEKVLDAIHAVAAAEATNAIKA